MGNNNSSKGLTIQIVNIKDSTVTADDISSTNSEAPNKEKEHARKNKSGQPPSERKEKTKTFPTRLVLLLILFALILLIILACCMLDESQFNKLIDFLNRCLDLFKSMLYSIPLTTALIL